MAQPLERDLDESRLTWQGRRPSIWHRGNNDKWDTRAPYGQLVSSSFSSLANKPARASWRRVGAIPSAS